MPHDFRPLKDGCEDLTGICKRTSLYLWALNFLRLQVYERAQHLEHSFTRFKVYTIDCLEAELNGKKVVKSDEWEATHNYRSTTGSPLKPTGRHLCCRGVYDMILDSNRLIASVYDTIQVWDLSTYQMTNLLNPKSLDSPGAATTCFAVLRDRLVKYQQIARTSIACLKPQNKMMI